MGSQVRSTGSEQRSTSSQVLFPQTWQSCQWGRHSDTALPHVSSRSFMTVWDLCDISFA